MTQTDQLGERLRRTAVLVALLAPALAVGADFVVIVNPANPVESLTRAQLQRYFLRHTTAWPSGEPCRPVDLPKSSPVRIAFSREVLRRSIPALEQFWTQSIFSGRGLPPVEHAREREVLEQVRENPGAIGYVSPTAPLDGVKRIAVTD